MKDQLVDKYLSGGSSQTGLFVVCWFQCDHWDLEDGRQKKATAIWPDIPECRQQLERQSEANSIGSIMVRSAILDCSLR